MQVDNTKSSPFIRFMAGLVRSPSPIIVVVMALLAGAAGLLLIPREEDPQISVPFADVIVSAPGLSAAQVQRQVTTPLESLLYQLNGVEFVYSVSQPGQSIVTVRFYVGEDLEESLVRIYDQIDSNRDKVPDAVSFYLVKPREVDDIPLLMTTLYSTDENETGPFELRRLAEEVAIRLQEVRNTNAITVTGGQPREVRVELDPQALATRQTTPADVAFALSVSNVQQDAGMLIRGNETARIESGAHYQNPEAIERSTVNVVDGIPVYLSEVAEVIDGPAEPDNYHWLGFGPGYQGEATGAFTPSVTISVAKRKGTNAVSVARNVLAELNQMKADFFPPTVDYVVLRNYGKSANEKVNNLISSLTAAIIIVIVFVGIVMGWRAALVVGLAIPVAYGLTLGLNIFSGYTINRVTLFALILSLGLLVDDPITGVDNIDRHLHEDDMDRPHTVGTAMRQISNALIMSTLAIIASFLPLSFITGLMGPYMAPMAFNVPAAVTMSTVVAFLVTPWMASRLLKTSKQKSDINGAGDSWLTKGYQRLMHPIVSRRAVAWGALAAVAVLFTASITMGLFRLVPLKLLPFDNKDEIQVLIDMPEGSNLEQTNALATEIGDILQTVPEAEYFAAFVGEPSPIDLNGLVRQHYLRQGPHLADIRVRLAPARLRRAGSHDIALRLKDPLRELGEKYGALVSVVEVPPGPPVRQTIVAEVYGGRLSRYPELQRAARKVKDRLRQEIAVGETDTTIEAERTRSIFFTDKEKAALSGVATEDVNRTLTLALAGETAGHLQLPHEANPLPIVLRLPFEDRTRTEDFLSLKLKGRAGIVQTEDRTGALEDAPQPLVALGEIGEFRDLPEDQPIYHKNLRPVVYVTADALGRAPADVILDVFMDLDSQADPSPRIVEERTYLDPGGGIPWTVPQNIDIVWGGEGELKITLRVFRDLGIAFAAAMVAIFLILLIQTGSAVISGIIMLAIPLSFIGILPGFWLLNVLATGEAGGYDTPIFFTATAMIGMIALAGIVVRNSLILVEFIQESQAAGMALPDALMRAGSVRARPILLTAGTTLFGNIVITLDPIFSGLGWAIVFGIATSTIFTLVVIPAVYFLVFDQKEKEHE